MSKIISGEEHDLASASDTLNYSFKHAHHSAIIWSEEIDIDGDGAADFVGTSKVCSNYNNSVRPEEVAGLPIDLSFYSSPSLKEFDKSIYGHKALIIESTLDANEVKINVRRANYDSYNPTDPEYNPANNEVPIIYQKINNTPFTLTEVNDLFGDGDQDYASINYCKRFFDEDELGVNCRESNIEINIDHLAFKQYSDNAYPDDSYVAVREKIKKNIVVRGDGTSDPNSSDIDLPGETNGEFILFENTSIQTGLVASITKPSHNQQTNWIYKPLSTGASDRPANFPLYSVPDRLNDDSYVDEDELAGDHFYFNSSMYVVSEMTQTNNYGANTISQYAYEEAVFNNKGRGFQGFRKISVLSNPSDGSVYDTVSESTFYQVFPYAGKLEKIETFKSDPLDPTSYPTDLNTRVCVQKEEFFYQDRDSNLSSLDGVYFLPLKSKLTSNYEINNNGSLCADTLSLIHI